MTDKQKQYLEKINQEINNIQNFMASEEIEGYAITYANLEERLEELEKIKSSIESYK